MILIRTQHKADLVYIIPVTFFPVHDEELLSDSVQLFLFCGHAGSLPFAVADKRVRSLFEKKRIDVSSRIAFQYEADVSPVTPVNDAFCLFPCQTLMHYHMTVIFNVSAVCADHSVQFRQIPLQYLRL